MLPALWAYVDLWEARFPVSPFPALSPFSRVGSAINLVTCSLIVIVGLIATIPQNLGFAVFFGVIGVGLWLNFAALAVGVWTRPPGS